MPDRFADPDHGHDHSPETVDRLAAIFERVRVQARVFQAGTVCGVGQYQPGVGGGHLHLLRRGDLTIEEPTGNRLHLSGPTGVLMPRPTGHRMETGPDGADLVCAELGFGGPGNPLEAGLPTLLAFPLPPDDLLGGALGLLFAEADQRHCGRQAALDRLAEVAVIYLLRRAMEEGGGSAGLLAGLAHPALARVLSALHAQPDGDWTLERMADLAGMSRSTFAETFRAVIGATPGDYLQGWRLQLARAGVEAGRSLKAVAREVGYASPAALSRALSQRYGASIRALTREARLDRAAAA
ncbi:MAG: hypothetical protein RLY86_2102 [Pseudomonadota bacterium]|jgi:AraC-like DNA-binding protein